MVLHCISRQQSSEGIPTEEYRLDIALHSIQIAAWGQRLLGRRLFNTTLKIIAFGHFVDGETREEITPVIERLQKYGVKPILDYSVENDDTGAAAAAPSSQGSGQPDPLLDQNTSQFIECIQTSHDVCGPDNLVAVKVTALVRPTLLKKLNSVLQLIEDRSSLPSLFQWINHEPCDEKTIGALKSSFQASRETDPVTIQVFDRSDKKFLFIHLDCRVDRCRMVRHLQPSQTFKSNSTRKKRTFAC